MKLRIEKAIYGGAGLARTEGKAVFVPMALPGETVEVAIERDKGSFAEAHLMTIVEPSPDRVEAACPYYGACGGCQYQHAGYEPQLAIKRSILVETLGRAGLRELPEIATHAGEPWGYRNRIRLHVDPHTHALGYRRRGSHTLLPVEACPIAAPFLQQALATLQTTWTRHQAGAWCGEVELFTDESSSALLLSLALKPGAAGKQREFAKLCDATREHIPQLAGAALFTSEPPRSTRQARLQRRRRAPARDLEDEVAAGAKVADWGAASLVYRVGETTYQVSNGAFFQANRHLVETLSTLATGSEGGALAWDLFAGVGLFAKVLARRFAQVTAVEGSRVSCGDLRHNLAGHEVVLSSTQAFLAGHGRVAVRPDLVVLDPPRAGLGMEASALLAGVRSANITYVSCDPATLSRDLRVLVDAGYTISQLHLVDMFPQTFHLETVARLQLR